MPIPKIKLPWGSKILLVADDPSFLFLAESLLGRDRIICCSDSSDAVDLIKTKVFSLLVTDTNIANVNGIELLQTIRNHPYPNINSFPVVVLFAGLHNSQITKQDVIKMGANLVMSKFQFICRCDSWFGSTA